MEVDPGVVLPFAPEVGGAAWLPSGAFVVGGLEPSKKELRALALLVLPSGLQMRVDLGSVHGDVLPPALAAREGVVVVAVPTGAPRGTLLRLARIDAIESAPRVRWGGEVASGADESDAFSVDVGEQHAVVAWDDWDGGANHSKVIAATLEGSDPSKVKAPVTLSMEGEDAESPVVVRRPGGFFAAWITSGRRAPPLEERKERTEEESPVDLGPRWITLRRLDEAGAPAGLAISVTPRDGHVLGFDLVAQRDGGALLAYREHGAAPGTSGGALWTVVVRAGGSIEPRRVDADELGAAVPRIFQDGEATWLSVAGEGDSTLLTTLDAEGREERRLAPEPTLEGGAPLAAGGSSLLIVRPRGRGLELSAAKCGRGVDPQVPITR